MLQTQAPQPRFLASLFPPTQTLPFADGQPHCHCHHLQEAHSQQHARPGPALRVCAQPQPRRRNSCAGSGGCSRAGSSSAEAEDRLSEESRRHAKSRSPSRRPRPRPPPPRRPPSPMWLASPCSARRATRARRWSGCAHCTPTSRSPCSRATSRPERSEPCGVRALIARASSWSRGDRGAEPWLRAACLLRRLPHNDPASACLRHQ
jgi:hypothetical protein